MRRTKKVSFLAALLAPLLLLGCSGLQALNLVVPHTGYTVHKNIAYDSGPRQKLDVYTPKNADPAHPVIVFFYGGSWQEGSKDLYRFIGQAFAEKGFVTVIADYRLYPENYFPDFMYDSAKAVHWTRRHIAQYGGNADNIFVAGHSAGAYNAAMLGLNKTYLAQEGDSPKDLRGVIGISGPYDFLPLTDPPIIALFSKAPAAQTQPINYVTPGAPPMLLLWGDKDKTVGRVNIVHLAKKLRANHDEVTTHIYDGIDHPGMALAIATGFQDDAPVLRDVVDFIHKHMKSALK